MTLFINVLKVVKKNFVANARFFKCFVRQSKEINKIAKLNFVKEKLGADQVGHRYLTKDRIRALINI